MSMANIVPMLVRGAYYSALGVWVGCMVMIAAGAPVAFKTLSSKAQAGAVVGGWLQVYYRVGLACAIVAAGATLFRMTQWEKVLWQGGWTFEKTVGALRLALLALMILNHLYAGWSVAPEIQRIRQQVPGEISALAADNPARLAFDALHKRSVMLMSANLLSGVAVVFLS